MDPLGLLAIEDKMALAMDLADVRILLEPGIADMAALHASSEDVRKLFDLCSLVEEKIRSGENYIEDDIAFHTCIAQCSKNKVVEQLIPIIDTARPHVRQCHAQKTHPRDHHDAQGCGGGHRRERSPWSPLCHDDAYDLQPQSD